MTELLSICRQLCQLHFSPGRILGARHTRGFWGDSCAWPLRGASCSVSVVSTSADPRVFLASHRMTGVAIRRCPSDECDGVLSPAWRAQPPWGLVHASSSRPGCSAFPCPGMGAAHTQSPPSDGCWPWSAAAVTSALGTSSARNAAVRGRVPARCPRQPRSALCAPPGARFCR